MAVQPDTTTGLLTTTAGSINFTTSGTNLITREHLPGDRFLVRGLELQIATITDENVGTLTEVCPPEAAVSGYPVRLRFQPDGARVAAQTRNLIDLIGNGTLQSLAELNGNADELIAFQGPFTLTTVSRSSLIEGAAYDAQVNTLADRAAYDNRPTNYSVLVSDIGDGRAAIYVKRSDTDGDWSNPAYVTGPVGPLASIEAGTTTTLPAGQNATVSVTPVSGGYAINIGVPQGFQGVPGVDGAQGPQGNGLQVDAVGPLSDRASYNSQPAGFTFFDTDNGDLYFRVGTAGNWSDPIPFQGPPGTSGAVITTTTGVGNGTIGPYPLNAAPINSESVWVSISGVQQYDYTISGTNITFGVQVPTGVPWQVKTSGPLPVGVIADDSVGADQIDGSQTEEIREKIKAKKIFSGSDYIFGATNRVRNIITGSGPDANIREIGNVIHDELDQNYPYKMVYSGHSGTYAENNVYVFGARSQDGITWEKTGQIISPRSAEDPYILRFGNTYYLYVEDKQAVPFRAVRLYTSTNFSGPWTDRGDVLLNGSANTWDSQDVSSPVVWIENSTWYMIFEGRKAEGPPYQSGAIGIATSTNGINWTKNSSNPIITGSQTTPGPAGWAAWLVPDDIRKIDDIYYLYFHGVHWNVKIDGNGFNRFACGMVTSTDLITWRDPLGKSFNSSVNDTLMLYELNDRVYLTGSETGNSIQIFEPLENIRNDFRGVLYTANFPAISTGTFSKLPISFIMTDSFNGWDSANSEWTCRISGLYEVNALAAVSSTTSLSSIQYYVNTITESYNLNSQPTGNVTLSGRDIIYLDRGDKIGFRIYSATAVSAANGWFKANINLIS